MTAAGRGLIRVHLQLEPTLQPQTFTSRGLLSRSNQRPRPEETTGHSLVLPQSRCTQQGGRKIFFSDFPVIWQELRPKTMEHHPHRLLEGYKLRRKLWSGNQKTMNRNLLISQSAEPSPGWFDQMFRKKVFCRKTQLWPVGNSNVLIFQRVNDGRTNKVRLTFSREQGPQDHRSSTVLF